MNETKRRVSIRLHTLHDGERMTVKANGHIYMKGRTTYIRFEEAGQEGGTVTTTVKVADKELTVIRNGAIRSEQRFAVGTVTSGYYGSAHGLLPLETETVSLGVDLYEGTGCVEWSYSLRIGGAEAGHFDLRLEVREDEG
jgi:uncharacterized beta-barrel protein YwiB (DUF1934 family)